MEIDQFRDELLDAIAARLPAEASPENWEFAFTCEVADRLTQAEEFGNFVPLTCNGTGAKGRRIKVSGYERDEAEDSVRLAVADFFGQQEPETLTRSRVDVLFGQLQAFVEDAIEGRKPSSPEGEELAGTIFSLHESISRYRFYLLSDAPLSERVLELPMGMIGGKPVDFQVWDIRRLQAVFESAFGAEELDIDFTEFLPSGLPCLMASAAMKSGEIEVPLDGDQAGDGSGAHYRSYLCVIPGKALAELYDRYGSRLLEGNVRSYLGSGGKINKEIQGTIRASPDRFFIYNNGISATATDANVVETTAGPRLVSAKYLQVVNGGQTTASLHAARRKDGQSLDGIFVQMKLTVVAAKSIDVLDDIIQCISKYSNKQNKVGDADFFSSHPFHRAIERLSRRIRAPAQGGAQFQSFWFYERARGQYGNAQAKLSPAERKKFQRDNPKSQLISKTDLAKFENTWRQLPHIVSLGAQKNFSRFADFIGKEWGEDGLRFDNEIYFKEMVAKALIFKNTEKLVTAADWYQGGYRANIVTYSIAKLACMIERQKPKYGLDFLAIWNRQDLSEALLSQLDALARAVVDVVTNPPVPQMNITEWAKKEDCWNRIVNLDLRLSAAVIGELVEPEDVALAARGRREQGSMDAGIRAQIDVLQKGAAYWAQLFEWSRKNSPLYGADSDIVRSAARPGWTPPPKLAVRLIEIGKRLEVEGFKPLP